MTPMKVESRTGQGGYGAHALMLSRYRREAYAGYKDGTVRIIDLAPHITRPTPDELEVEAKGELARTINWRRDGSGKDLPVATLGEWGDRVLLVGREGGGFEALGHCASSESWSRTVLRLGGGAAAVDDGVADAADPAMGRACFMGPLSHDWFLISTSTRGWLVPRRLQAEGSSVQAHLDRASPLPSARRLLCVVRFGLDTPGWLFISRDGRVAFVEEADDPASMPGPVDFRRRFWLPGDRPSIAIDYAVEKSRIVAHPAEGEPTERDRYVVEQRARSVCLLTDKGLFRIYPHPSNADRSNAITYDRIALPHVGRDCAVLTACEDSDPSDTAEATDSEPRSRLWAWDRSGRGVVLESPRSTDTRPPAGRAPVDADDRPWRWRFSCDIDGDVDVVHAIAWSWPGERSTVVALGLEERVAVFRLDDPKGPEHALADTVFAYAEHVLESPHTAELAKVGGRGTQSEQTAALLRILRAEADDAAHRTLETHLERPDRWGAALLMWVDAVLGSVARWALQPRESIIDALCAWVRRLEHRALETSAEHASTRRIVLERAADRAIARARKWGLEGARFRDRPALFYPRAVLGGLPPPLRVLERAVYETLMFERRFDQAWHSRDFSRSLEPLPDPRLAAVRAVLVRGAGRGSGGSTQPEVVHSVVARIPRRGQIHLWWRTAQPDSAEAGIDAPLCRAWIPEPAAGETRDAVFVEWPGATTEPAQIIVVRLEDARGIHPRADAPRSRSASDDAPTTLTAYTVELSPDAEESYEVDRRDSVAQSEGPGARNRQVLAPIEAREVARRPSGTGPTSTRFDVITAARAGCVLVGLSGPDAKPRTTLALYRIDPDEGAIEPVDELAEGVIRSAYPASGTVTAENPIQCIAMDETHERWLEEDWYAIACADGRIWAGRLDWTCSGVDPVTRGTLARPVQVARVGGRPTALAMRIHRSGDGQCTVRVFTGTEDGSVMAFEHIPGQGEPTGDDSPSSGGDWVSLWSTFEEGPIDSIHAGNAYDYAYDHPAEASGPEPAVDPMTEEWPWVIVVTRAGRLSIFDDPRPRQWRTGGEEWARLSTNRRPVLAGERFDRGRLHEPIIGSAFMRAKPDARVREQEHPDRFHVRLVVGTEQGDVRILQLRQLKYTGWRRWRRQRHLEPTWRELHDIDTAVVAPPEDAQLDPKEWPFALFLLRRCEAVKHVAPELADNHVAWMLEQYPSERVAADRRLLDWIGELRACPAHLHRIVELARFWNTPSGSREEIPAELARRLSEALEAAHGIDDIGLYKALVRATMTRMNREIATGSEWNSGLSRSGIGPEAYARLFDVLGESVELWRARPDVYIRLRILLQQRASDGDSLSRMVGWADDARPPASRERGSSTEFEREGDDGEPLRALLRARVRRAADNLTHGDLLLALETLRAVNAAVIRTGWTLMRARARRCSDIHSWRPGPSEYDARRRSGEAEVFRWDDISPYFDALADFAARLGAARSGRGDAVLHEVVRGFALGVCITPTAAAAIAYRTAETNLPDELVGRIVEQFGVLRRQGLSVPEWAERLFRAAAAYSGGQPDVGRFSLAEAALVTEVLGLAPASRDEPPGHALLSQFAAYTLRGWPEQIGRVFAATRIPGDGDDTIRGRDLVDAAIGRVNRIVLTPWVRYDLIMQWLDETTKALVQDAARVDLEPIAWLVHAMAAPAVPTGDEAAGASAPRGYSYHHSWVFWRLAASYLRSDQGPDHPREAGLPELQVRLAREAFAEFHGEPIRQAVQLSISPGTSRELDPIWDSRDDMEGAVGALRRPPESPDRVVQPALVVAAPYLSDWAARARMLIKRLEAHNELFRPQVALYDSTLAAFERAARIFPTSAAVQANIVQGVLGHSLLESLSDLTCHLYALAQVADPSRMWRDEPSRQEAPVGGDGSPGEMSIAERLAEVLARRAFNAQTIPKNLLLLAELTAPGAGPGPSDASSDITLARLAGEQLEPGHEAPWKVSPTGESDPDRGLLTEDVASILRVALRELGRNERVYGEAESATMRVDRDNRRLTLESTYKEGDEEAERIEKLLDCRLQDMVLPHPKHPGESHGMGLYLSNLALSTVGWRLHVEHADRRTRGLDFIIEPASRRGVRRD